MKALYLRCFMSRAYSVPSEIIRRLRRQIMLPLKDAMKLRECYEHERNYRFHRRSRDKRSLFRSYSFVVKGRLKHEMYLKAVKESRIREALPEHFDFKLIITPPRSYNPDHPYWNTRKFELVVFWNSKFIIYNE